MKAAHTTIIAVLAFLAGVSIGCSKSLQVQAGPTQAACTIVSGLGSFEAKWMNEQIAKGSTRFISVPNRDGVHELCAW